MYVNNAIVVIWVLLHALFGETNFFIFSIC